MTKRTTADRLRVAREAAPKKSKWTVGRKKCPAPTIALPEDQPHLTDEGNAQRLVRRHGAALRHCQPWRKWICWDGQRWKLDDTLITTRCAKDVPAELYEWAQKEIAEIARGGSLD